MNRVIKFRAYDMEVPEMIHWEDRKSIRGKWELDTILEDDSFIVMQFTGLLDKNGKEIYEGDILMHKWEYEEPENYKVLYEDAAFIAKKGDGHYFTLGKNSGFEIVGNIYENFDLLTTTHTEKEV